MSNTLRSVLAALVLAVIAIAPGSRLNAADANFYPDDTELVVVVNLKQILSSEMIKAQPDAVDELKEVLGRFAGIQIVQKYLKEAGFEAYRDLTRVTYVYTGAQDPKVTFLLLEGEFSSAKLNDAAKVEGSALRSRKTGNGVIYEINPRGEKRFHAALVNQSTLLVAIEEESLSDALARAAKSRKSGLKKELRKLLESMDERESIAFVASGAGFARRVQGFAIPNAENAIAFVQTLDAFSGGITLAKGINVQLAFNAETEEIAKKLAEAANSAVRILLTLTQQTAEKDPKYMPLVDLVKGLRFANQGVGILFRGEINLDTLEKLMTKFPIERANKDRK